MSTTEASKTVYANEAAAWRQQTGEHVRGRSRSRSGSGSGSGKSRIEDNLAECQVWRPNVGRSLDEQRANGGSSQNVSNLDGRPEGQAGDQLGRQIGQIEVSSRRQIWRLIV